LVIEGQDEIADVELFVPNVDQTQFGKIPTVSALANNDFLDALVCHHFFQEFPARQLGRIVSYHRFPAVECGACCCNWVLGKSQPTGPLAIPAVKPAVEAPAAVPAAVPAAAVAVAVPAAAEAAEADPATIPLNAGAVTTGAASPAVATVATTAPATTVILYPLNCMKSY
jgi:hypothetical protein